MTKSIDDFFGLPPADDPKKDNTLPMTVDMDDEPSSQTLKVFDKMNEDQHDRETDDVRNKAIETFEELVQVGKNINPEKSARIFEVAGQFLKLGLDAANSKMDKQLKAAKLKIEAKRLKVSDEMLDQMNHGAELMADRNELIKQFLESTKENIVDLQPKPDTNSEE